jgi:non-canonical poly(A) RNA polymerase PAPD5/7
MASNREFLRANRAPTPELMAGMEADDDSGVKYRPAEDLSDSDDAEMDMSDNEAEDGQPAKKRAKIEPKVGDGNSTHKWSNPDPYTVLPPPDESQKKKKDVLKLIRKARVSTGSGKSRADTEPGEFISLDFGEESDDKEDSEPAPSGKGVVGAPSGPRALLQQRQGPPPPKAQKAQAPLNDVANTSSNGRNVLDLTRDDSLSSRKGSAHDEIEHNSGAMNTGLDPNLGGRKRNARDEILKPPPMIHKMTKGKPPKVGGQILKEWKVLAGDTGTPWRITDHSDTASMGVW